MGNKGASWVHLTEFEEKLIQLLPKGVRYFGGRELHKDGTPHYHVVFQFEDKVNWPDAAQKFLIEGDTNAIRFQKPRPRQSPRGFLENTMAYCGKDEDTFGQRLPLEGAASEQKKRKWQDIIDEPDESRAWDLVRELEPRSYMLNYPALERAMGATKRARTVATEKPILAGTFRVPELMTLWMERYVIKK